TFSVLTFFCLRRDRFLNEKTSLGCNDSFIPKATANDDRESPEGPAANDSQRSGSVTRRRGWIPWGRCLDPPIDGSGGEVDCGR
ncbi:hypothetical protein XELAEV_18021958mg, partial [Xenopus laevis]